MQVKKIVETNLFRPQRPRSHARAIRSYAIRLIGDTNCALILLAVNQLICLVRVGPCIRKKDFVHCLLGMARRYWWGASEPHCGEVCMEVVKPHSTNLPLHDCRTNNNSNNSNKKLLTEM